MGPVDIALAPYRGVRLLVRAADDLNAVAERARRDPDPVEQALGRIDALLDELRPAVAAIRSVDARAGALDRGLAALLTATARLHATAETIVTGGDDLRRTGDRLDGHTVELIGGGAELTEVSKELAETLRVFRAALPRLLDGLETAEGLEDAAETVAATVEPLQGLAAGVGRVSARFGRGD